MCGLSGIAGRNIYTMDLDYFKDLLYLSAFRGKHSTGVAAIRTNNNVYKLRKHVQQPAEFIDTYGGLKGYLSDTNYDIMMGHARWATKGQVVEANAHPFDTQKYIGAHNGTLVDHRFQSKDGKTDSEMMFREMDQRGIVETIEDLSPMSAWAVSIYDKHTRKLWLGRNSQRGLYVAFLVGAGVMAWSSEQAMLEFAAYRDHGPKINIYRLQPGVLYEIDIRQIKNGNHSPWIAHTLKKKEESIVTRPIQNWDGALADDIDNDYYWDKASQRYVPITNKKSAVSELVDELEESIEASRRAEEGFQKSLLI